MTTPTAWQPPPEDIGPAPGIEFAGYGGRLLAYILDGFLIGIVSTVLILIGVVLLAGGSSVETDASGAITSASVNAGGLGGLLLTVVLASLFSLLYFPWFWARGGQTPGMRVTGLRVVSDRDGSPIGWGTAFVRLIGLWIAIACIYIGIIWIFIDKRRRGWQDLIAGTLVIKA